MRAVIQRVSQASVLINNKKVVSIKDGILVLLGIETADTIRDATWLANKISTLRIFSDNNGKMNKSILDIEGEAIVVSQFTLHAKTKKGNRPSYIKAARAEYAKPIYKKFKEDLSHAMLKDVKSGEFGSDMKVSLTNDGPVTIIIDTKNKQ